MGGFRFYKAVGIVSLAFGGGILLAELLPSYLVMILEAILLAATGFFYAFKV